MSTWSYEKVYELLATQDDTETLRPVVERINICDFLIRAIGIQMASVPLEMFQSNINYYIHNNPDVFIPGIKKVKTEIIDIRDINIVGYPRSAVALADAIRDIYHDKEYNERKQSVNAAYYKELNLIMMPTDGNHHGMAANVFNYGTMKVDVFELSPYFDTVKAMGDFEWEYLENGKRQRKPIFDMRLAAMYELAEIKYELQKSLNSNI